MSATTPFLETARRHARRHFRAPVLASALALVAAWSALTPSLLPRSSPLQGVVVAVAAWAGYGLGALIGWAIRRSGGRLVGPLRRRCWQALAVGGATGSLLMIWWYYSWENELRDLVGMEHQGIGAIVVTLLIAALLFTVLIAVSRLVKAGFAGLARIVGRFLPAPVATLLGVVLTAFVVYTLLVDVATSRVLASLDAAAVAVNDEFRADRPAPTNVYVSAGPNSAVEWDKLGRQGRVFISNRPSAEEITRFSTQPATEPVRAYVGIGTDGDIDLREQAIVAADELERLGGFDRAVVNVVTGTGRGWVNEDQAQALEYMWNGDTATVSMQYSYLPSPISFLVDRGRAKDAGRLLFDAVFGKWLRLPEASRPKLVVSGESLGSFGGEAAFSGEQDMANRIDGALFVGPTNANELWSRFTEERDPGSTEMEPIYDKGEVVRFAGDPADWELPSPGWEGTRVGYLQHANDPITWWNWSLAVQRPDWLKEEKPPGVSPDIRWIPGVTMLQLGADQLMANEVPAGQGHRFGKEPVWAWAAILPPPGWTSAETARLAAGEPLEGD
ncbi:alpha/beta hydrolase [Nocardioides sp. Bht2]|uniref:alpha/beta hydrolase n=1 Tax=Nocardioides sp. Bht2 TaxID=3392297 RepID=UPI0039B5E981